MAECIKKFLIEVTQELLYNIVYEANEIRYDILSDQFEEKTGFKPMKYFAFGNKTGGGWFEFITRVPGLQGKRKISILCDNNGDGNEDSGSDDECAYNVFNTTYLNEKEVSSSISVAKYREMILIKCCQNMKDHFSDLSSCKDANGNTPLHLIAALPGISYNCSTLVKYLLQAGVDPLAVNNDGQTFLHIIFGRFKAERDIGISMPWLFARDRVATTKWFVDDRVKLLDLLSEELSQAQTSFLVKARDMSGNNVMHEFAFASLTEEDNFEEGQIYQQLLKFGATLRISNNEGELPLHYAFNQSVFRILVDNGAPYHIRNDNGETPLLFILKYLADLAFAETSAFTELTRQGFVTPYNTRSVQKALRLLKNLWQFSASPSVVATITVWLPDRGGNVAINIILIAIRLASYKLDEQVSILSDYMKQLRFFLVKLLSKILDYASPSDMKRQNKKGQSFLHVLLDMAEYNKLEIINNTEILQSVEILLNHNADVNAVDSDGNTPLDIIHKHYEKAPSLYKKCAELLIQRRALVGNNSASPAVTNQSLTQSGLVQRMSNLHVHNKTRKLRSCPKRHLSNAQRLIDPKTEIAVVGKYRYSNQDPIGSGAFSIIFVAIKDENVDSRSGAIECRAYALKRLDKAKINPQEIKREITTLLSMSENQCENIIKCHEAVEDSFFQYICLDLMDGDLHEFVTNNGVNKVLKEDPAINVQVTKEIINGLAFLHEQKFIHRDLNPGNILYKTDPTLHFKIADFGLTKNMSPLSTMTSTRGSGVTMAPGTRCWMAPELVSMKSREHTEQSDVFSLGLVLHYLLTLGKHPFATGSEERAHVIERNIEEIRLNLETTLHPEAISFLQNILKKDQRPQADMLTQHPFLWSERKKIEFLKSVGDEPEAASPAKHVNSALERELQKTQTGQHVSSAFWNLVIRELYEEMTNAWKQKKYRTDKVIDLIRFIRNAYAHRQGKSLEFHEALDKNIFLREYPTLVLDVFGVVQKLGLHEKPYNDIRQALVLNT